LHLLLPTSLRNFAAQILLKRFHFIKLLKLLHHGKPFSAQSSGTPFSSLLCSLAKTCSQLSAKTLKPKPPPVSSSLFRNPTSKPSRKQKCDSCLYSLWEAYEFHKWALSNGKSIQISAPNHPNTAAAAKLHHFFDNFLLSFGDKSSKHAKIHLSSIPLKPPKLSTPSAYSGDFHLC
jgi:hypothetical protein